MIPSITEMISIFLPRFYKILRKNKRKERAQKGRNHVGTPYTPQSIGSPAISTFVFRILSSGRLGLVFVRWDRTLRARPPSSHLDKRPGPRWVPRDAATETRIPVRRTTWDKDGRIYTAFGEGERVTDTLPDGHRLSRCGKGTKREQPTRSYDENRVVWKSVWVSVTEQRVSQPWILLSCSRLFDQTYHFSRNTLPYTVNICWFCLGTHQRLPITSLVILSAGFAETTFSLAFTWISMPRLRDCGEREISVG